MHKALKSTEGAQNPIPSVLTELSCPLHVLHCQFLSVLANLNAEILRTRSSRCFQAILAYTLRLVYEAWSFGQQSLSETVRGLSLRLSFGITLGMIKRAHDEQNI